MFNPYYIDTISEKVHTFPNDCALKAGLVRAWRRGDRVFDFRYRPSGDVSPPARGTWIETRYQQEEIKNVE